MRSVFFLLFALCLVVPGCGPGNIGDLFSAFPESVFEGDEPGGPGDGGGPFTPADTGGLGGSDGVTGDVRNLILAQVGLDTYAFLTATTDGIHIVNVTEPDLINRTDFLATIPSTLLAGGRCDAIAFFDRFIVCLAVGTSGVNGVTVINVEALIEELTTGGGDASVAVVPLAPGDAGIPVPGTSEGKGGGASGGSGQFFVATGLPTIAHGVIAPDGMSWSTMTPLTTTAEVAELVDVIVNSTFAIYASGTGTLGRFGIVTLGHPLNPIPVTPTFEEIDGEFDLVLDEFVTGPGNFPLDLALDSLTLYVTGEDSLQLFNVTNPIGPTLLTTVENTGIETISVAASGTTVVLGANDALLILTSTLGQAQVTGQVTFGSTFTIRGVALHTTDQGTFCICAAGEVGVRVVQLAQAQR